MNIYILTRLNGIGYDEYDAKVVVAKNEQNARKIANESNGCEGKIWNNKEVVSCQIVDDTKEGEVLGSYNAG